MDLSLQQAAAAAESWANSDVQSELPCRVVISFLHLLIAEPIAGDFEREICVKKTPNL